MLQAFREPLHRIPRSAAVASQSYYRPVAVVWLSVIGNAFDDAPAAFRAAGLGVGALVLVAFALLARRLLGADAAAGFAALFVAVHPVGIESFVWISGISGPLCALFCITALGLGLSAWGERRPGRALALGALSVAALLAGLLSKERAVVVPGLLAALLLSAARLERLRPPASAARRALLLVAAHAAAVGVVVLVWRPAVLGSALAPVPWIGGSPGTQLLSAVASWPGTLGWLLVPLVSTTNDGIRIVTSAADLGFVLGLAVAAGSAVAWVALLRGGRPVAALGLAWIWLAFLPTAGLLPMLHARGERYLFLSAFGAALLAADLGVALVRRLSLDRRVGVALACVVLAFLAQRTWARLPAWESTRTLFEIEVARDPEYREGRFLLAAELAEAGRHAEADVHLRALLYPERPPERSGYLNLLPVYELACANELSLRRYSGVLDLERRAGPSIGSTPSFQVCLGEAKEQLGRPAEALAHYRAAAQALGAATPPSLRGHIERLRPGRG